jgi:hypothetical protein
MADVNIPGVIVNTNDKSAVTRANISTNFCMIGAFERGSDDTPFLIGGGEAQFQKVCGIVDNALNKQAYVSAIQMLKFAQGIWMINVTKNALFGGMTIESGGADPFDTGFGSFAYNFYPSYLAEATSGTGTGPYTLTIASGERPIKKGSVVVHYLVSAVPKTAIDDGAGGISNSDISAGTVDYVSGAISITFTSITPDAVPTVDHVRDLSEAFALFANSKKSWSSNFGIEIFDHTKFVNELVAIGDGSTLTFSFNLKNKPVKPKSVNITVTIGGSVFTKTDAGDGTFATDSNFDTTGNTVNYTSGAVALKFKSGKAPDSGTNILFSYSLRDGFFEIWEFQKLTDGSTSLINKWTVSRDPLAVDQNGQSAYIEDVINNNSTNFKVINNSLYTGDVPEVTSIAYCAGGVDGVLPTDTEKSAAISIINNNQQIDFSTFVGCGVGNVGPSLVASDLIPMLINKNAVGIFDLTCPSDVTLLVNDLDDKHLVWYAQNDYINYNGKPYLIPMSATDAAQFAQSISNTGQFYLPPNGITRGTLNVTKMDRYFTDPEIEILQAKRVNVVRFFKSYGNVIFSNLTGQKKLSATTYRNSVLTLNDMIKTFNDSLLVVDFDVINSDTFRRLRTTISDYLDRLAKFDGTIEPNYTLNIETLNNAATKDAKKIYAELIFVFQSLAEQVIFTLTYTSNQLYLEISK